MRKLLHSLLVLAVALAVVGCSNDSNVTAPSDSVNPSLAASVTNFTLPEDATFESATFHILVDLESGQNVDAHRITDMWNEMTVTWNNFGMAYDMNVEGTFAADAGWQTVDISGLVGSWLDGTDPNYGLLLNQSDMEYPRTLYYDRESGQGPYLVIGYSHMGDMMYDTVLAMADAYIYEIYPDSNFGDHYGLWTGRAGEGEPNKKALVWFDLEVTPPPDDEGCSHTIGYWKTHAGFGPQADMVTQHLPIYLGDMGGDETMAIMTAQDAVDILKMKTYGKPSNGITKLYAQLLGTKLSIADGASDGDVADAIQDADAFLADYDYTDWKGLSKDMKDQIGDWKGMFDAYNNGEIGPGHCDD